jgi:curved DNA-binding protein CbpA
LKKNYRLLQVSLHPDRDGDPEEFKKLQELYDLRYNQHKDDVLQEF